MFLKTEPYFRHFGRGYLRINHFRSTATINATNFCNPTDLHFHEAAKPAIAQNHHAANLRKIETFCCKLGVEIPECPSSCPSSRYQQSPEFKTSGLPPVYTPKTAPPPSPYVDSLYFRYFEFLN